MNRITQRLSRLRQQGQKALVTYIVSGDPYKEMTVPMMHELVSAGADIIELGVPFSDPMAEGPAIQLGHERALAAGASLRFTLGVVKQFREQDQDTPVVLMGYANPVERMGYNTFAEAASDAGVDGLLTVDLPPEESGDLNNALKTVGIENIFLLAPTTSRERAKMIVSRAGGFLYYVSLKGVTGAGHLDIDSVHQKISELREITDLPLCAGFGIKDAESAQAVAGAADGVVIGSVLVNQMGELAQADPDTMKAALSGIVAPIRQAIDHQR